MKTTRASIPITMSTTRPGFSTTVFLICSSVQPLMSRCAIQFFRPVDKVMIMAGIRETIPVNKMMEPTPNSVICSPSHIRNTAPAVKDITMTMAAQTLSLFSRP